MKQPPKNKYKTGLYYLVLLSFLVPIGFLIVRLASPDTEASAAGLHSRADYALMLVQCVLGLVAIHIPSFLAHRLKFELPAFLYTMYIVFLYCAVFLGEVRSFSYRIPYWDDFLHSFSSMMTGFFAFMVVTILNRDESLVLRLSPFFVALFAFTFSVAIGAIWEVYEFSLDGLLGLNMQKFIAADGVEKIGHAALTDTMKDVIVDILGALLSSVIGYISLRRSNRWLIPSLTEKKNASAQA